MQKPNTDPTILPFTEQPTEIMHILGQPVWWIASADDYRDIPEHDFWTYTATPHRFYNAPKSGPLSITLHYDDTCGGQPVIIIGEYAFGLGHVIKA